MLKQIVLALFLSHAVTAQELVEMPDIPEDQTEELIDVHWDKVNVDYMKNKA